MFEPELEPPVEVKEAVEEGATVWAGLVVLGFVEVVAGAGAFLVDVVGAGAAADEVVGAGAGVGVFGFGLELDVAF